VRVGNLFAAFKDRARRFALARGGNVAITFAMATVPVIGGVGAAVDYSHANSVKVALQAALDSTALMLSKEASTDTSGQLQQNAAKYFKSLFTRPEGTNVSIAASYTTSGGAAVVVNGQVDVPTVFMGIMGHKTITVQGSSTVKWGSTRLRVALVLDNTGSMAEDGKMTALKDATKSLLTQLKSAAGSNGDVYVSIIPFSKDVNVGTGHSNGDWIDWDDWETDNGGWQYTYSCNGGWSRRGRSRCNGNYQWVTASHTSWNGCITDRDQNYDQDVTPPKPSDADLPANKASTLYPAEQYQDCPAAMRGLSYDWTAMNSLVDQMYPKGNTNQPIGLVWGWLSLTGGGPLSAPAMDSNYDYKQIIILLSDGLNTENRWTKKTDGESDKQKKVDDRMYKGGKGDGTCANIKAAKITIYAIQVNTGNDPKSTLLQNCASDSNKFWMLTSASQISATFNQIGTNLTQLRVAR
jgi:Flp pilus assembly protein TadG